MFNGGYTVLERPAFRRRLREKAVTLEVVHEPLGVPAVVRPTHEPHVLYVRIAALRSPASRMVSVDGELANHVQLALRTDGLAVERAVIVGADAVVRAGPQEDGSANLGILALIDVVRALTDAEVPFVWRTRAGLSGTTAIELPPVLMTCLQAAGRLCTVELGIATLEDELAHALEGTAAVPPSQRLRLAQALTSRGIAVRALVDPLVPMLTDQQAPLTELLQALVGAGVHHIAARYVVLTRERAKTIAERLGGMQRALLQGVFAEEPWRSPDEDGLREVHKRIPAPLRRQGHERLVELAAKLKVRVEILDPADEPESMVPVPSTRLPRARIRPQLDLFRKRSDG